MSKLLTERDFIDAADLLGIETAVIKSVAEVEAPKGGFLPSDRPTILFEAHIFGSRTKYIYNTSHPNISSRSWNRKLYRGGEREYDRLAEAKRLNEAAALMSASWGKFQIMGFNFRAAGFQDVFQFVKSAQVSEREHLLAFCNFITSENLVRFLKVKDWTGFAKRYNGPKYYENKYDEKMADAYKKHKDLEKKTNTILNIEPKPIETNEVIFDLDIEVIESTPITSDVSNKLKISLFEKILLFIKKLFNKE